jgi:hypothetical protein
MMWEERVTDIVERLRLGGWAISMATRDEAAKEIERLRMALAIISYMDAQCGEDAMKMRSIATDITMWERPDSMWWYGKDYGPAVASEEHS